MKMNDFTVEYLEIQSYTMKLTQGVIRYCELEMNWVELVGAKMIAHLTHPTSDLPRPMEPLLIGGELNKNSGNKHNS